MKKNNRFKRLFIDIYAGIAILSIFGYIFIEFKYDFWILTFMVLSLYVIRYIEYLGLKRRIEQESIIAIRSSDNYFAGLIFIPIVILIIILLWRIPDDYVRDFDGLDNLIIIIPAIINIIFLSIVGDLQNAYYLTENGIISGAKYFESIFWYQTESYELIDKKALIKLKLKRFGYYRLKLNKEDYEDKLTEIDERITKNVAQ
jgi:hypothetical protein